MEFVCLSAYGKLRKLIGVGDDRELIGNMRINNFGYYKYVLKCTSTYICEYKYKKKLIYKKTHGGFEKFSS
jgi:hypothetical protein